MNEVTVLPDDVFTIEHIVLVTNQLDQCIDNIYRKKSIEMNWNPLSVSVFEKNNVTEFSIRTLETLRKDLVKLARDLPRVSIRTAQPVMDAMQLRIHDWVTHNIAPGLLLSFHADHTLLAGVIIQTPRSRFDYTLKKGLRSGRTYLESEVSA